MKLVSIPNAIMSRRKNRHNIKSNLDTRNTTEVTVSLFPSHLLQKRVRATVADFTNYTIIFSEIV